jgi:galactose-1-phosphate uridylyltransferase
LQYTKDPRFNTASSFQEDTAIVTMLNIYNMPCRILFHFSTMPQRAGKCPFDVSSKSKMDLSNVIEKFLTRVTKLVESRSYSHTMFSK